MIVSYKSPVESNPASAIVKFSFMLLFRGAALCPHPSFHHLTDDSVQTLRGEVRFSEWGPATALIPLLQGASSTSRSCRLQMRNSFKGENVLGVCVCVFVFQCVFDCARRLLLCADVYVCGHFYGLDVQAFTFVWENICDCKCVWRCHERLPVITRPLPHHLVSLQIAELPHINSFCDYSNSPQ